ncbi:MAG: hypothetical protein RLZZ342_442 [Candidatus Parcubacteria bacterium]|jgi:ribose 5-phosphate isomerase B
MKIFLASDHAGFALKEALVPFILSLGHEIEDCGPAAFNEGDDYPVLIAVAAQQVSKQPAVRAIVVGGSGTGEAIVANRFPGVRAAVYNGASLDTVRLSREHNDANVLSLGARFISVDEAHVAVKLWLDTSFSGEERHLRRIDQIEEVTRA